MFYGTETDEQKFYRGAAIATAPFRALESMKKFIIYCMLGLIYIPIYLYKEVGWRVGVGPHGYNRRMEQLGGIEDAIHADAGPMTHQTYRIDFTQRSPGFDWDKSNGIEPQGDGFINGMTLNREGIDQHPSNNRVSLLDSDLSEVPVPSLYTSNTFAPDYAIDPCSERFFYKTQSWDFRPQEWLLYKSIRWQNDLIIAAVSIGTLRTILTEIKLGMAIDLKNHKPCEADFNTVTDTSRSTYTEWERVSQSIKFPDAPVVNVQEVRSGVVGVCDAKNCDLSLMHPHTTFYDDIHDGMPYITPAGEKVEKLLYSTTLTDFWLKEAHRNGVWNRDQLIESQAYLSGQKINHGLAMTDSDKDAGMVDEGRGSPIQTHLATKLVFAPY